MAGFAENQIILRAADKEIGVGAVVIAGIEPAVGAVVFADVDIERIDINTLSISDYKGDKCSRKLCLDGNCTPCG